MKKLTLIILILLFTSLTFGQSGKSVLTQAQKDSINAIISDSSDVLRAEWVEDISDSLDTKLAWVSVKEYGAVGDGSTNDSSAFARALATGKDIRVPSGMYVIGKQYLTKTGQKLIAVGSDNTVFRQEVRLIPATYTDTLLVISASSSLVQGFYLSDPVYTNNYSLKCFIKFKSGCNYAVLKNIKTYKTSLTDSIASVIIEDATNSLLFDRCIFLGYAYGIVLHNYAHNSIINNCKIVKNWMYGIWFNSTTEGADTYTFTINNSEINNNNISNANASNIRIDSGVFQLRLLNNYAELDNDTTCTFFDINHDCEIKLDGMYVWMTNESKYFITWAESVDVKIELSNLRLQLIAETGGLLKYPLYPNKYVSIYNSVFVYNTPPEEPDITERIFSRPYMPSDTTDLETGDLYNSSGTIKVKY